MLDNNKNVMTSYVVRIIHTLAKVQCDHASIRKIDSSLIRN